MIPNPSMPSLADGAARLLPGLQHARAVLDTAIQVCEYYAKQAPHADADARVRQSAANTLAENVHKTKLILAAYERPRRRSR